MLHKAVFPGQYLQGVGALRELPGLVRSLGRRGLILASPTVAAKILPRSGCDWAAEGIGIDPFGGECCEEELARLADGLASRQIDVLVGMGGGKTIDTAKIAADRFGIPVIVVPSIASTDAPCSAVAVLYSKGGVFERVCFQKSNPAAVLVDVAIVAAAPARFLVAGMGDALSTWFEARSCRRTQSPNECGGLSTLLGLQVARLCFDTLLAYGQAAKVACERQLICPALEHIIEANVLLSGIGFESAGLAAAHAIHNGLTALEETHAYYHGEKVAIGVLAGLQLADAEPAEVDQVYGFCEGIGLPTTLADIGLDGADPAYLMAAAQKACAPEQPIHKEAGEMTPERVLQALLAADALGRVRAGRG